MNNTKTKIIGLLILPILIAIYFIDRLLCVVIPFTDSVRLKKWFENDDLMTFSVFRTGFLFLIILIVYLINLFIF